MNKKKHYRRFLLLLAMLLAMTLANAQTDSIEDSNVFANWNRDVVYLLPSKEICETGEDLWFKAYLMDWQTLALSDKSQTLYLQMRSEKGDVVWSEKYPLMAGRGDGHIYIGDTWQQGEYYMEGYTSSSFTADNTTAIRPRRIRVVDCVTQMDSISAEAIKSDSFMARPPLTSPPLVGLKRFNLFPEGGYLVDGINSVVAFKATYGNGFPDDVSGKVLEDGKEIASFISVHNGMGKFALTPRLGKDYKVVLTDGRKYPLPAIERTGMTLRILRNNNTSITMLVSASDSLPHPFTVFAKQRSVPCCSAKGIVRGQQIVRLPIERFPQQGIAEMTLSDEYDYPVAERLVYVNPAQRLNITASTDHRQYNRRDAGKVHLQVTNSSGQPLKAELAISIFDKAYLYLPGHENILSHCYLSEQIRGNIFNPTYYYDERNEDRLQALDLLLMTQGWRCYVWNEKPIQGRPVLKDELCGRETTSNKLTSKMQLISAFALQSDSCFILTDSIGGFEITSDQMNAMRGNIYLKPLLSEKYKAKLTITNPFDSINFYQQGRPRYLPQNFIYETANGERAITNGFGTVVLKDVYVTAKRRSPYRDKVTGYLDSLATMASGEWVCECKASQSSHYLNNYKGYSHHPDGCSATTYSGKRLMPKRGENYELIRYEPVGSDGSWIVTDITSVKYSGPQYTEEELLRMYGMWKVQGYYPRREFYEPDPVELASPMPDPRNLLQWKPYVLTDENGEAEISFRTSDVNTEFIGIVEAIDGTGLMGCQTFTFRVIRNR